MIIFRKRVAGLSELALARFVKRACSAAGVRGAINVLVTGSGELRELNRRFRKKDKMTDVLSFPPMPGLRDELAGDVAISAEIAKRNARHLGHSDAQEVKILALHGILHLAGYDHERDRGRMARKEQQLRNRFSLPDGLIERLRKSAGEGARATFPESNGKQRDGLRSAKGRRNLRRSAGEGARATPAR